MKLSARKLFSILLIFLFSLTSVSLSAADSDGTVNYLQPFAEDKYYEAFCKHVFDGGSLDEAIVLYDQLEASYASSDYPEWMQKVTLARASCILGRYCIDINKKANKEMAREYMRRADELIALSKEHGAPESASGVVEALASSYWFLVDGSLSKGMQFSKIVDRLYKNHPEDFHVLLMSADRFLHSPPIVGGNKKKGLRYFQQAEKVMGDCAIWDEFTVYSGLAYGYEEQDNHELAVEYAELAYQIYTADPSVNEILGK